MDSLVSTSLGMAGPARVELPPTVAYADVAKQADTDIEAAAKQFESLFVNMMLKSMRAATASLTEDNYLSSKHVELHQEMLDQQYATELAGAGGIGLAEVIVRQMGGAPRAPSTEVNPLPTRQVMSAEFAARVRSANDEAVPQTRASDVLEHAVEVKPQTRPERSALFESAEDFIKSVGGAIKDAVNGTPFHPVAILAQAALETGWGKHVPQGEQGSSHNLFGIKADARWSGPSVELNTQEFLQGRMVTISDAFRAYESVAEGVRDYVRFISESDRYAEAEAVAQEPKRYADALVEAGYATDPAYADKLKALIDQLEQGHDGIAF